MRLILIPLACLFAVCLVTQADASALSYLIGDYQTVNILEDNDYETAIDANRNGFLDEGDYLLGMWEVQDVKYDPSNPPPEVDDYAFTAIFLVKVTDADTGGDLGHVFTFEAASENEWDTFLGIDVHGDNSAGIMYSDGVKDYGSAFLDHLTDGGTPADPSDDILASLETAKGTALWEFGFTDDDTFWTAEGDANVLANVTQLKYAAGMDVIHTFAGAPILLPHMYLTAAEGIDFLGMTDLQLAGGNDLNGDPGNFEIATDTDIYIVPTPEPASLALLGLGLAAFGGVLYRRRRKV